MVDRYDISKKNNEWQLKKQGADRASKTADTKADIIKKTQDFMEDRTGSVRIHKENGRIQEERTYHRPQDPKKSPG